MVHPTLFRLMAFLLEPCSRIVGYTAQSATSSHFYSALRIDINGPFHVACVALMWLSSIRTMLMPFKSRYLPHRVNYFFQANHESILSVCVSKRWYTVIEGRRFPCFKAPVEFVECLRRCPSKPIILLFFQMR